ncbi:methyltransferase domain-containing protein [Pseudactinotalea suaedae]|uniref:methyltransferase domain-containing protein n=1 Tax=Pseudactinotalea suaedae TaxID=1524924 RepID=UPI0012E1BBB7|nr:methyltransferase domain-containing protein [Pseudactinotalea suaedae]
MASEGQLLARWREEEREQPTGWSFADLEGRMRADPTPWDFPALCVRALGAARCALDMGTGGGETLLGLKERAAASGVSWPAVVTATEGWAPNVAVARDALATHGIEVREFGQPDDDPEPATMPFDDGAFDVVLNRHEAYHPAEVARVLAAGGAFLTQQVGGDELGELRDLLGHEPTAPQVRHRRFRQELLDAGLEVVDGAELVGGYTFTDVAALVAYLQRVPWEAPADFTVDRYADPLLDLHRRTHGGQVRLTMKRFWLKALRPS